jgi:hypothetical protein
MAAHGVEVDGGWVYQEKSGGKSGKEASNSRCFEPVLQRVLSQPLSNWPFWCRRLRTA